jgi:hypothetical protein
MYRTEKGCGGVDWINLAKERGRWRAVVNVALLKKEGAPEVT